MDPGILIFLTSGLFLGWALGANDAANVFGTAVGTRMIRFTTAAIICSIFVVLGATISGAGAAHTLGKLGAINALPGSFMAALAAAVSVYLMTKAGWPVSTTQAIVGAIVGWNLFSETITDQGALIKILSTWVICPILAAVIAAALFKVTTAVVRRAKLHMLRTDAYTRAGLVFAGAFGAYSLGANNIANVMGVFVPASPFTAFTFAEGWTISSAQQLFLLGAVAIAVGVMTYSKRVMMTVGGGLMPLSPIAAWVAVVSHSVVLFLFASQGLEHFLASNGLPTIPLVPVSSSQAVVGAVLGIALLKGGRGIRWRVMGGISMGWAVTPLIAGVVCYVGLFFLQNVFDQPVYRPVPYAVSDQVVERLQKEGIDAKVLSGVKGEVFDSAVDLRRKLKADTSIDEKSRDAILAFARQDTVSLSEERYERLSAGPLNSERMATVVGMSGRVFAHEWMLKEVLAAASPAWQSHDATPGNRTYNRKLANDFAFVIRTFRGIKR